MVVGSIIVFLLKMKESTMNFFTKEKKEKNFYNKDIILKEDEHTAGQNILILDILSSEEINKIIKKQQNIKKGSQEVNLNEYKIIKNMMDDEEGDIAEKDTTSAKEIQELHKEINLHVKGDKEDDEDHTTEENIEDLKASILNHD